ncbi:protein FAM124A-like [Narcine bancroftii]|uniref:protein FAM124A-like n=1 Tax=Narcine bancroftii TaxID=1343680 RepID=UPI0038320AC7
MCLLHISNRLACLVSHLLVKLNRAPERRSPDLKQLRRERAMERRGLKEDWGPETGGSDFSCKLSTNSELCLENMPDPFLVTMHIITDPGCAMGLQNAIDSLVSWIKPGLGLFVASERSWPLPAVGGAEPEQPALAVVLSVHKGCGQWLHEPFLRPPWRYHHTEHLKGWNHPSEARSQDFFTLADHTVLWAVRQACHTKGTIHLALYCSFDNFAHTLGMYRLILRREASKHQLDTAVFTIYSSEDVEIQLSLRRLPKGRRPSPSQSALLEFRVHNLGCLVPLLPHPCSPISERRWQTEDHDGNKLLLQVRDLTRSLCRRRGVPQNTTARSHSFTPSCTILPQYVVSAPERCGQCQPMRQKPQLTKGLTRFHGSSQEDLWGGNPRGTNIQDNGASRSSQAAQRSKSLFCLPTFTGSVSSSSSLGELALSLRECHKPTRVPARGIGPAVTAQTVDKPAETEVDTGLAISCSDLSDSTLDGFSQDLNVALPSLWKSSRKTSSDLLNSSGSHLLSSFCEWRSSSFPHFQEFSPSNLKPCTLSPRDPIITSWLRHKPKQPSSPAADCAAGKERGPKSQQPTTPHDTEQEFYI